MGQKDRGHPPPSELAAHLEFPRGRPPEPLDHFLVQADLTVVAPGPLEPSLAIDIGQVADVESAGSATVYRVTEASVRRALDIGRTRIVLS